MDGNQLMSDLLNEFGDTIGTTELKPDEEGYCSFSVDDSMIIHLKYEEEFGTLRFFTELEGLKLHDKNELMEDLLNANVLWRGTNGATIGLDSKKNVVTLSYQEPISGIPYVRFEQILEGFIITAETWIQRIHEGPGDDDKESGFNGIPGGIRA